MTNDELYNNTPVIKSKIIETLKFGEEYFFVNDIVKITTSEKQKYADCTELTGRISALEKDYGLVNNPAIELDVSCNFNQCSIIIDLRKILYVEKVK